MVVLGGVGLVLENRAIHQFVGIGNRGTRTIVVPDDGMDRFRLAACACCIVGGILRYQAPENRSPVRAAGYSRRIVRYDAIGNVVSVPPFGQNAAASRIGRRAAAQRESLDNRGARGEGDAPQILFVSPGNAGADDERFLLALRRPQPNAL